MRNLLISLGSAACAAFLIFAGYFLHDHNPNALNDILGKLIAVKTLLAIVLYIAVAIKYGVLFYKKSIRQKDYYPEILDAGF